LLLLSINSKASIKEINALDLSPSMLAVAKQRCETLLASATTSVPPTLSFHVFDALDTSKSLDTRLDSKTDLVLSTLVLEHLPVDIFFKTVTALLKPDGVLVLTNMHGDMGRISQAGFVDPETGEKVRGTSYVYEIEEVVQEAKKYGLEVIGDVQERVVREDDIGEGVLGPRGKKWIGVKVWFGWVMRLHTAKIT
jgi:SAM-dependent methyltransferase